MKAGTALGFSSGEDKVSSPALAKKILQYFLRSSGKNKFLLVVALGVIICLSIFQFLIPQITRYAIDVIIPEQRLELLPWVGGAIFLILIFIGVLNFCRLYLMSLFGERAVDLLRTKLYQHLQKLSISFFASRRTGDLMSRLTRDITAISNLVTADISETLVDIFTVLAIVTYLLLTDWQLTLLLILTWPVTIYIIQVFGKFMREAYQDAEYQAVALNNQIQDTISNINVIKSFGNEEYEIERFSEQSRNYKSANLRANRLWSIFVPTVDLFNSLSSLIVLVLGSWAAIAGRITIGELAAFLAYIAQVTRPVLRFSKIMNVLQMAFVGLERILEILETEPEVKDKENAIALNQVEGDLQFEQVSFGYKIGETVLNNFTLDVQTGMTVALVGSSGAGKSTVAKLAARFYDPQEGRILIDGQDIRDLKLESVRSHLGIVSQETLLLYGTIRDNIAYGKLDATDEEIAAAAKAANAHDFIQGFPKGYNAIVGERGIQLSGGQRQRLAIARVLLKNPQFVLLDEATSALDTESEKLIQESLNQLLKGRTSLVIAHRLSTIKDSDLIVVLEKGQIIETGTHLELIAKKGRYATLHNLQFPQQSQN